MHLQPLLHTGYAVVIVKVINSRGGFIHKTAGTRSLWDRACGYLQP